MNALSDPYLGWSALAVSIIANVEIDEAFERLERFPKCNQAYRRNTRGRNVLESADTNLMLKMRRRGMEYGDIAMELGVTKWCVFNRLKRLKAKEDVNK